QMTTGLALACLSLLVSRSPVVRAADKKEVIQGRVLADVGDMSDYMLLGDSPNGKVFIFGMESVPGQTTPVKVLYEFFKWQGRLPTSFFDYGKRYELTIVRDPGCDETIEHLSYMQAEDQSGKAQA